MKHLDGQSHGRRYLVSKIQDGGQPTGSSNISETTKHIIKFNGYHYVFGVNLSSSGTSDFAARRYMLEIQDGSQITGSSNNFAGFTNTHAVSKTIQEFMTMYETSRWPAVTADATSCRRSKMAANQPEVVISPKL